MKTLLSIGSILLLTVAAMSLDASALDASALDAGDWLMAALVAALFGFALNDVRRCDRPSRRPV